MWERSCVQNISQPWLKWFLECQAHRLMGRIDGSNGQVELAVKDWQVALDDSPHRQWRSHRQAQPHNQNVCPCLEALREAMSVFFGYGFLHKWGNGAYQCPTLKWQLHDNYSMWNMGKRGFESLDMGIPCFWHGQIHTLSRLEYATFEFPPFWGSPWVNWHSQGDGRSVLLGWNSSLGLEPLGAPHATHAASGWGAASGWWQRPEERLLLNPPGNGWDDWVPVNQMHRVATPSLIPQSRDHWFGRQPLAQVLSLRENLEIISIDWLLTKNVTAVCTNPSRNLQFFFMCFYLLDPLSGWTFHSWWNLLPLAPISVGGFLPTPSLVPRRFHQDLPGLQGNQLRDLRWFLRRYLREYVLSICIFKD